MAATVTETAVRDALRGVIDPDLNRNIVELGFVKNVEIDGARVSFDIELTTPACPVKDQMEAESRRRVLALEGVDDVAIRMTSNVRRHMAGGGDASVLPGVKNTIAVASGKGGVGKSTVAANLACALAMEGSTVGLLDADIYGPSAPIMFGIRERPVVEGKKLHPILTHGVKVMSLGLIADDRAPVIWRGPLVARMIQQFLTDVEWGELEYLVIDLPPGTGDVQLTLAQTCPLSGAVIVTTPQEVALEDVYRAVKMFGQVNVPVMGIIENMSVFIAPDTGKRYEIFRSGGGKRAAEEFQVPLLAELPLAPEVCESGDAGNPAVIAYRGTPVAEAYADMARQVAARLSTLAMAESAKTVEIRFARKGKDGG